jgi:hypothetical protein
MCTDSARSRRESITAGRVDMGKKNKKNKKGKKGKKGVISNAAHALADLVSSPGDTIAGVAKDDKGAGGLGLGALATGLLTLLTKDDDDEKGEGDGKLLRRLEEIIDERLAEAFTSKGFRNSVRLALREELEGQDEDEDEDDADESESDVDDDIAA